MSQKKTGAVIVAAGMSSRMGHFKPLLDLGGKTIAQHVVDVFLEAGVSPVIVVTGKRADDLERHLSDRNVLFIRNEEYATTDMFDSARIGFLAINGLCDRVFFTPVDVPLFTLSTVKGLLETDEEFAFPVCGGRSGHPVLLQSHLLPAILSDSGEDGLRGALGRCVESRAAVLVEDAGILYDADTPDDYQKLLDMKKS